MVLTISQKTFSDAVQDNVDVLGLSPEEAIEAAILQFQSQGVDLSQIITTPVPTVNVTIIIQAVNKLKELINSENPTSKDLTDQLAILKQECDKGVSYKVEAGKASAYDAILDVLLKRGDDLNAKKECLKTLASLMNKQPDLLNDVGTGIILSHLNGEVDPEVQKFTLKWTKECCVLHEMNRQKLYDLNIVDKIAALLPNADSDVLREALAVFRALILDDDVRVEFGNGHEHAKAIANKSLGSLTGLLNRFKNDELVINDLMLTLASLLVRAEFCKQVEETGGLQLLHEVMTIFPQNDKIIKQCFKLIKALCGNDDSKAHIIQKGLAPDIANALTFHKHSIQTAVAGLSCIAALSLRNPENSKALFEAGLPEIIVEIMKQHPNEKSIQRGASWAVRNMVSRSRYQNEHFLELGVEEVLQEDLQKFKDFEYDIKAALRDLGCKVDFKEEWTGQGGAITSDSKTNLA